MRLLVLNASDVERLLPMRECIEVMAEALAALARGQVHQPVRTMLHPPGAAGLLGLMPSYLSGERPAYGLKAVCVFHGNVALGKDAHQGVVMLFSGETGEPLAVMNASAITAIRTAAVSAVATRLLARPDAGELAIVGSGVQARTHLEAIACVRPLRRVRIASRNPERARRFAGEVAALYPFPVEAVESTEAAVRGADIIVAATTSTEPVVRREWISPGAHLNAIGAYLATTREIDSATVADAALFVDQREAALRMAGDYLIPLQEGVIAQDHLRAEIGEVLTGAKPGRTHDQEITLFKSLGLAVEDLAAAEYLHRQARETGAGAWVEF